MLRSSVSITLAVFLLPGAASAFGTKVTHEELARLSIMRADVGDPIDRYLRWEVGLELGLQERLAVQPALDQRIEADLVVSDRSDTSWLDTRLNRSLSRRDEDENGVRVEFPPAPGDVWVPFEPGCRDAADFDLCFAALPRAEVQQLIRIGTYAEDNPNPRARHHFHDPERSHGPFDNHGLDDSDRLPSALDSVLAEVATAWLRGGSWLRAIASIFGFSDQSNFKLRGRSALDRALNLARGGVRPASEEHPDNHFGLPDAERYLYRSLTSPEKDECENYLALHFVAVGHVLHLLQDMGSVAHTRNDFVVDHVLVDELLGGTSLETAGDRRNTFNSVIAASGTSLAANAPHAFLTQNGSGTAPLLFFDEARPLLDPTGFDVADFWDRGSLDDADDENPARAGLAERVHNRFFSAGTISNLGNL